jgi:phosphotriesterase-related protein
MSQVMTVRGPVDFGELGFTLMHEHLMSESQLMYERRKRQGLIPDPPPVKRDDLVTMANLGYLSHSTALARHNPWICAGCGPYGLRGRPVQGCR